MRIVLVLVFGLSLSVSAQKKAFHLIEKGDKKLQKGLDPKLKANRVANYAIAMREEVDLIAHSCGVLEPRYLSVEHAFVVGAEGAPERLQ